MSLEVVFGARQQASLFSDIDAFRAASEVGAITQPYFDKGDGRSVSHDKIDFTVPATIIPRYQPQAVVEQVPASKIFRPSAAFHSACTGCIHCRIGMESPSSIRGVPFLNRAHMSRRLIRLFSLSERLPVMPWNSAYCWARSLPSSPTKR